MNTYATCLFLHEIQKSRDIRYFSGCIESIEVVSDPITTVSQANAEIGAESHDQDM
jgi:hypothetical protein